MAPRAANAPTQSRRRRPGQGLLCPRRPGLTTLAEASPVAGTALQSTRAISTRARAGSPMSAPISAMSASPRNDSIAAPLLATPSHAAAPRTTPLSLATPCRAPLHRAPLHRAPLRHLICHCSWPVSSLLASTPHASKRTLRPRPNIRRADSGPKPPDASTERDLAARDGSWAPLLAVALGYFMVILDGHRSEPGAARHRPGQPGRRDHRGLVGGGFRRLHAGVRRAAAVGRGDGRPVRAAPGVPGWTRPVHGGVGGLRAAANPRHAGHRPAGEGRGRGPPRRRSPCCRPATRTGARGPAPSARGAASAGSRPPPARSWAAH